MSWMSKKTGRPKEEGGHKRIDISVDEFTDKALDKIRKGDGNVSRFIEKQLKPVLENLDPGEASIHVWRIESYLRQQIIKATKQNKPGTVQALASIGNALDDFRKLCGIPPLDYQHGEEIRVTNQIPVHRREPRIVTFITTAIISIFGFVIIQGLSNTALQGANQTMPEILKIFVRIYPYIPLAFAVIGVTGLLLEAKRLLQGKLKL